MADPRTAIEVIQAAASPLTGKRVIDIGCGEGFLAAALADFGAEVTGIDPEAGAIMRARKRCPGGAFLVGTAENLALGTGSFDVAAMVNVLHHVPVNLMAAALLEAKRVLAAGGQFIVIEPEASGSFFEALRPIEDETEARVAAQEALSEAVAAGLWEEVREYSYVRAEQFVGVGEFIARVVDVDPSRMQAAERNYDEIKSVFRRVSRRTNDGQYSLEQPIVARVLSPS